ncbi:DOPA 4,5-dioxygenase family protein [Trinickia mobilis]|uniref:DOPA 4,5-dioxygenase family protein n=1 Tax=Trinickia mobilis TaxID=2816356 RepID=UPI001A8EE1A0|nr:DOPA 4,5-dioxygenase family protein [Trinickia mobilis]
MTYLDTTEIADWHAHVYFDAASRDAAWTFREAIETRFGGVLKLGRFHERLVGPHPQWSYQLAFDNAHFAAIFAWLSLNHGELDVFVHPNTGDSLRDHRDSAAWIGRSHVLVLSALGG